MLAQPNLESPMKSLLHMSFLAATLFVSAALAQVGHRPRSFGGAVPDHGQDINSSSSFDVFATVRQSEGQAAAIRRMGKEAASICGGRRAIALGGPTCFGAVGHFQCSGSFRCAGQSLKSSAPSCQISRTLTEGQFSVSCSTYHGDEESSLGLRAKKEIARFCETSDLEAFVYHSAVMSRRSYAGLHYGFVFSCAENG